MSANGTAQELPKGGMTFEDAVKMIGITTEMIKAYLKQQQANEIAKSLAHDNVEYAEIG